MHTPMHTSLHRSYLGVSHLSLVSCGAFYPRQAVFFLKSAAMVLILRKICGGMYLGRLLDISSLLRENSVSSATIP